MELRGIWGGGGEGGGGVEGSEQPSGGFRW